jgi:hypothetical protein
MDGWNGFRTSMSARPCLEQGKSTALTHDTATSAPVAFPASPAQHHRTRSLHRASSLNGTIPREAPPIAARLLLLSARYTLVLSPHTSAYPLAVFEAKAYGRMPLISTRMRIIQIIFHTIDKFTQSRHDGEHANVIVLHDRGQLEVCARPTHSSMSAHLTFCRTGLRDQL